MTLLSKKEVNNCIKASRNSLDIRELLVGLDVEGASLASLMEFTGEGFDAELIEELFLPYLIFVANTLKPSLVKTQKISIKSLFRSAIGCQETTIIIYKNYVFRFTK